MIYRSKKRGRVTLPVEKGMEKELKEIARKWRADMIRNSDGTELPECAKDFGMKCCSTVCLVRLNQEWIKAHPEMYPQKALITDPETAFSDEHKIYLLKGYFDQQFAIDTVHDPKRYFEVKDRTTGEVVDPANWQFDNKTGVVAIKNAIRYHAYTVSFLVYQIWDTTSMYNHVTNNWTTEHISLTDPRQPVARVQLLKDLENWLLNNPETDVVRLTSLAYHFTNNFTKHDGKVISRYRDWVGYHDCTSVMALEDFQKEYGYQLKVSDLTDDGLMNDVNKIPSKQYLDWMDFIQQSVSEICSEWVKLIHDHKREAMTFFCDHWIGAEPYGKYFDKIGIDIIVNPCMSGIELRRIADIPLPITKEVRLYPYFFPFNLEGKPSFAPGGDPVQDCNKYWKNIRRAMLQRLPDRIGFGGYLSLAAKFPEFIEYTTQLCDEFRELHDMTKQSQSLKYPFKVAILNCWGKLRSWIDDELNSWTKPYSGGVLECLAGMSLDVTFINFDDILRNGIPDDVDVIINMGQAKTSWSGGHYWQNPELLNQIRQWVNDGGAFIGIQDPSASEYQGLFFQLYDVLGVDCELGYSISKAKLPFDKEENHFIIEDASKDANMGNKTKGVFKCSGSESKILMQEEDDVILAVNSYGQGRSIYMAGLQFCMESVRLLTRCLFWATKNETKMKRWFSSNQYIECAVYPVSNKYILMNYSSIEQTTDLYDGDGNISKVTLKGYGSQWFDVMKTSISPKIRIKQSMKKFESLKSKGVSSLDSGLKV